MPVLSLWIRHSRVISPLSSGILSVFVSFKAVRSNDMACSTFLVGWVKGLNNFTVTARPSMGQDS
jgi:hypothetical protein